MITDSFLNSCYSVVLNEKSKVRKNLALYRDISNVLDYYENKEKLDIPISMKNKYECLKKICEMKIEGKDTSNILDSFSYGKFSEICDFIQFKADEDINDSVFLDNVRQIRLRKKVNSLFANYDQLTTFVDSVKDGTFESIDNLVLDYEEIIKSLFSNMMEENRGISIESSASLDLHRDDYEAVIELIKKKYERKNTTSTGFDILDNEILNGGYESSRIYIYAGGSGSG